MKFDKTFQKRDVCYSSFHNIWRPKKMNLHSKFQNSWNNFRTIVITVNSFQCMFLKVINIWKFPQQSSKKKKSTWYYPTSSLLSFESPPKLPSFPSKFHQNPTRSFPVYFAHFRAQNLDWGGTKHFHHHHSHYPEKTVDPNTMQSL